jgi:hypothetical protein
MMSLGDIIAAGARRAALLAEEDFRAQQWEGVREVAHRVAARGAHGDHGWGRILAEAGAVGEQPTGSALAIDRGSRMTVRRPGEGSPAAVGGALGAGWDRALAGYRA